MVVELNKSGLKVTKQLVEEIMETYGVDLHEMVIGSPITAVDGDGVKFILVIDDEKITISKSEEVDLTADACPFCGADEASVKVKVKKGTITAKVECGSCSARGPVISLEDIADEDIDEASFIVQEKAVKMWGISSIMKDVNKLRTDFDEAKSEIRESLKDARETVAGVAADGIEIVKEIATEENLTKVRNKAADVFSTVADAIRK